MEEQARTQVVGVFYEEPIMVGVRYEKIMKEPRDEPQEAEARFQVNGESKKAFVPLYAVDENECRAFGAIIGDSGGKVIVEFPPTTLGQSRFTALKEDLDRIAIYKHEGS
jgi:hypothetical protein